MEYKIVFASKSEELEIKVNALLGKAGSQVGGVAVHDNGKYNLFFQAMIKE